MRVHASFFYPVHNTHAPFSSHTPTNHPPTPNPQNSVDFMSYSAPTFKSMGGGVLSTAKDFARSVKKLFLCVL